MSDTSGYILTYMKVLHCILREYQLTKTRIGALQPSTHYSTVSTNFHCSCSGGCLPLLLTKKPLAKQQQKLCLIYHVPHHPIMKPLHQGKQCLDATLNALFESWLSLQCLYGHLPLCVLSLPFLNTSCRNACTLL